MTEHARQYVSLIEELSRADNDSKDYRMLTNKVRQLWRILTAEEFNILVEYFDKHEAD